MNFSNDEIDKIDSLSDKIRDNTANLNDYEEYEKLLIKGGYTKDSIMQKLKNANIESYKELIDKRKQVEIDLKNLKEEALDTRKIIEGIAIVGLVAIGLALLYELVKQKK
jgi:hypothetical protein